MNSHTNDVIWLDQISPDDVKRLISTQQEQMELERKAALKEATCREIIADSISSSDALNIIKANPELIHVLLIKLAEDDWLHYQRLADKIEQSAGNVHRFFKAEDDPKRSTPTRGYLIRAILEGVADILRTDVERIRDNREPIGHITPFAQAEIEAREARRSAGKKPKSAAKPKSAKAAGGASQGASKKRVNA
jgi:hypothetical protein